jgi:hypothetical protein
MSHFEASGTVFDAKKGSFVTSFLKGFLGYLLLFFTKLRGINARFQKPETRTASN